MDAAILSFDFGKVTGWTLILSTLGNMGLYGSGHIKNGADGLDTELKKRLIPRLLNLRPQYRLRIAAEAPVQGGGATYKRKDGSYGAMCSDAAIACRAVTKHYCKEHNIPFDEFMPATIKKAVTGNGRATKKQVREMTQTLLGTKFSNDPRHHKSDAGAVGITKANRLHLETSERRFTDGRDETPEAIGRQAHHQED